MTREEEACIIDDILAGQTDQFETLMLTYEKGIYSLALRMLNDPQDALDASQETFFRAYRGLSGFRKESSFSSWLHKIAANVCLDMLRKQPQQADLSLTDEEDQEMPIPSDDRFSPQSELERKELREAVRSGLMELPLPLREVLLLREINGLSYGEIAEATGWEINTVKTRIFRARKKMAAILSQDGNFYDRYPSDYCEGKNTDKGGAEP